MKIFDGKKEAEQITNILKENISQEKIFFALAIILIGDNPESELYIKKKEEKAKELGIGIRIFRFKEDVLEEEVIRKIGDLNLDNSIAGIIVQLPMPEKFNIGKIINSIDPRKDVDGFHSENRKLLKEGRENFIPVLPSSIYTALSETDFSNKEIIILVNSDIFGETLKVFLERKDISAEYIVKKEDNSDYIKERLSRADVIISVCGDPGFIKKDYLKKGVILIDAGIRVIEGHLKGDVLRDGLEEKASFLTPVPGGIGPLTVALLLTNVYLAAKKYGFGSK